MKIDNQNPEFIKKELDKIMKEFAEQFKKAESESEKIPVISADGKVKVPPINPDKVIDRTFWGVPKKFRKSINKKRFINPQTNEDIQTMIQCYLDYILGAAPEEELQTNNVIIQLPNELQAHIDYFEKHLVTVRKNNSVYGITKDENNELSVKYLMPIQKDQITYLGDYTVMCPKG